MDAIEQAFNKKIKSLLTENPNSEAARVINKIVKCSRVKNHNFYAIFDDFGFMIGMDCGTLPCLNKNL